ncbi:hypothetical protein ACH4S9_16355 [Streptomyces sp. NPDC021225]|uniref:hypothetical protein n=1 Tax=Streptomyces sp. NPDC021225 TaxID=3365121 RepID=UPI0037BA418F
MRKLTLSLSLAAVCATSLIAIAPAATASESGAQASCVTLWQAAGDKDESRAFSGNDSNFVGNNWSSGTAMNDDANSGKNNCGSRVGSMPRNVIKA